MSAAKKKNFSYKNFAVKDAPASTAKSRAKTDSATSLKLLESKYRSSPIALAPGKSKAVAKLVVGKKGAKRTADSTAIMPAKKAFFLKGKPLAYQG